MKKFSRKTAAIFLAAIIMLTAFLPVGLPATAAEGLTEDGYVFDSDVVLNVSIVEEDLFYVVFGVSLLKGSFDSLNFQLVSSSDVLGDYNNIEKTDSFQTFCDGVADSGGLLSSRVTMSSGRFTMNSSVTYDVCGEDFVQYEFSKEIFDDVTENDVELVISLCKHSGASAEVSVIEFYPEDEHVHIYTPTTRVDANCTDDGYIEYGCDCGASFRNIFPALGHSTEHISVAATCTEDGEEYDICTECGDTFNHVVIPALGHSWSEWTQYSDDKESKTCSVCGRTEYRYIMSSSVVFSLNLIDEDETSVTVGAALDKGSFNAVDFQVSGVTENVGECEAAEAAESLEEFALTTNGSCLYVGNPIDGKFSVSTTEEYSTLGENFAVFRFAKLSSDEISESDIMMNIGICGGFDDNLRLLDKDYVIINNLSESDGHTHKYIARVDVPVTCTTDGTVTYICSCGDYYTETVTAGHAMKHVLHPATCTADGEEYDICTRCGMTENYQQFEATGHNIVHRIEPVTCMTEGREYDICENCCEIYNLEITPSCGHEWGEWRYIYEEQCTKNGYMYRACLICGELSGKIIPKLGHSFCEDWHVLTFPTETEDGEFVKDCIRCGEINESKVIPCGEKPQRMLFKGESSDLTSDFILDNTAENIKWTSTDPEKVSVDSGIVTANAPGRVFIIAESEDGTQMEYFYVISIGLTAKNGSVIDEENGIIYGFAPFSNDINYYAETGDEAVVLSCNTDVIGTGSVISVNYDGNTVLTYETVIFGDVNGDGKYDGTDAVLVHCAANGMLDEISLGKAAYTAADCNHDGTVDVLDAELLEQAGLLLAEIEQLTDTELESSSVYAEYLSLIEQTVLPQETEESVPDTTDSSAAGFIEFLLSIIKKIIVFFKSIKAFLIK